MELFRQRPRSWAMSLVAVATATAVIAATLQGDALENADVRANVSVAGDQVAAAIARDADGDYVLVWSGNGDQSGEADTAGVFFQQFDRNGDAQGPETRVNTTTAGDQRNPSVAMDADGNFTVVWEDCGTSGGTLCDIFMQRYDSGGAAQGLETAVNLSACGDQRGAAIAMASDGSFVVAWQSLETESNPNPLLACTDADGYDIFAQQFSAEGLPAGLMEFQVNTTAAFGQTAPSVAADIDGDFVVAWQGTVTGSGQEIFAQAFTAAGDPAGGELRVNVTAAGDQTVPAAGMSGGGAFVIAWEGVDASGRGIFMRRYNAARTAQTGADEAVNATTAGSQSAPAVAVDASGDFVVTWAGADSEPFGIFFQRYDAAGVAQGGETAANVTTAGDQAYPAVGVDADGDFAIAWESDGQDGNGYGVYARRFAGPEAVNLSVLKTDSADPVGLGAAFSYTVTVTNGATAFTGSGNATVDAAVRSATGVTVVDTLPVGVTFNSGTGTGWSCSSSGSPAVVTCVLANTLEAGDSSAVTLNVNSPAGNAELLNTVTVSADQYDPSAANNTDSEDTYACSGASAGTLAFQSAAFTVAEDGDGVGGNDDGLATITVTRSGSTCGRVSVQAATTAGGTPASTATAGQDYTATVQTLTLENGEASKTFTVAIADDAQDEPNETVNLVLSGPTRATLGAQATAVLTITDNDALPVVTMSLENSPFSESGGTATVRATLDAVSGQPVTVNLAFGAGSGASSGTANRGTNCGGAQAPADYNCSGVSITIPAGSLTGTATLTGVADTRDENDLEPVPITASCGAGTCTVTGTAPQVTAQVQDDDVLPTVQFTAAAQPTDEDTTPTLPPGAPAEATSVTLTAQLSAASDREVTVAYAFDPDSPHSPAKATPGTDFAASPATPSTLTFAPGETSKAITLTTIVDAVDENNELAVATLSAPTNATLGSTATHTVTITDNDVAPTVNFNPVTASVSPEANTTVTVTAELSTLSNLDVTVPFTVSGSAANPADHGAQSGSITIVAGETTGEYTFSVSDDALDEANETVVLTMGTPVNATAGSGSIHTTTITDNDNPPNVTLSTSGSPFAENGGVATITATLGAVSGRTVTVNLGFTGDANRAASCGTVQNPADYACSQTTIVIAAGNLSGSMTLTGTNDTRDENDAEGIVVTALSCASGACSGVPTTTTAEITDDDTPPTLQFTATGNSVAEDTTDIFGDTTGTEATLTVQLSAASDRQVTVDYTLDGTANRTGDYTLSPDIDTGAGKGTLTFAPGETSKTLTVTTAVDAVDEENETAIVTLSGFVNAGGGTNKTYTLTITDNDAAPTVAFDAPVAVPADEEGAETITATVRLSALSERTVSVPLSVTGTAQNPGDHNAVANTITIPPNTDTGSYSFQVLDDALDEANETVVLNIGTPTNATPGMTRQTHTTTIDDSTDPEPTVQVDAANSTLNKVENGGTGSIVVTLSTASGRAVAVPYSLSGSAANGSDYTISPVSPITFAAGETSKTLTVTVINDTVDEPNSETLILTLAATTGAALGSPSGHTLTITDDDDQPQVSFTSAGSARAENSGDIVATLQMSRTSTSDVTVPFTVGGTAAGNDYALLCPDGLGGTQACAGEVIIAAGQTSAAITIDVTPDSRVEGDETVTLTMGTPVNATSQAPTSFTGTIQNDDAAGITLTQSGTTDVTEGGATDSYTLVLTSEPIADVTISLAHGGDVTTPASVVFTSANWDDPQTVTVTAVDDAVAEDNDTDTITHAVSSADPDYDARAVPDVAVSITDNDSPDIVLTESGGSTAVTEGGATDSYTLVLTTQPTADVVITLSPTQVLLSTGTVTFTSGNWNVPQVVTVTADDDQVAEGAHAGLITHAISSGDPNYSAETVQDVAPAITDNDNAGVTIAQTGGTAVTEGGTPDTYTIVLESEPTADVTITLSVGPDVTVNPASVTFNAVNWNLAREITVTAVNDDVAEGTHTDTVTHDAASTDPSYGGAAVADVEVTITDNETVGFTLVESGGSTTVEEGGATDGYTLVLTSQPAADVVITLAGDADVGTTPATLTFTSANWNVAQPVTVTAVDDALAEGTHSGTVAHAVDSADPAYDGQAVPDVVASITDNETAGITVTESGGATAVTEGGATDSYTLVLTSQPTSDVVINVNAGPQASPSASTLTFTPFNWFMGQTVTVTATDDSVAEGAHDETIFHVSASSDPDYNGAAVDSIAVAISDNDTAGVLVAESGGATGVVEGGATDTYTVVLTSEPTADVTVTVSGDADAGGSPGTLTFTSANWSVAQVVTVTAVDDLIAEGAHTGVVTNSVSSADTFYNGAPANSVSASITDNDAAGVIVTESGGSTSATEGGATDTYTLVLTSQPTADVTITASGDADVGASPGAVTFTSANWNVAQLVTVSAVDDALAEGAHTGTLTHTAVSNDPTYDAVSVAPVATTITDNDLASVVVTESGGSTAITEDGATDTYTVVLTSQPTADVTVTVTGDVDAGGSPASLTFTSVNWNVAQAVTVTAVNDALAEGAHSGTLTHAASSADLGYNAAPVAGVVASITDNDAAGVVVTESGGSTAVTEGGATDTYTIVLTSQPTADVTITVAGDADIGGSPASLTFTSANWNVAQTVTATAVNDALAEGAHSGTLTHAASSADLGYNAAPVSGVVAAISDNDTAGVVVTESGGSTAVTEGGATDTYTIVLTSQPTADVTITVAGDADIGGSPASLTFTSANWNVAQAVTATATDDALAEGNHSGSLTHAAGSSDPGYNGAPVAGVTASIADNDTAGVIVTESGGSTSATEGGATDTYTVVLTSQPTADVTVTVSGDADAGGSPGTLTFTSANWSVAQVVTVTAVDDLIAEGAHTGVVTNSVSSADTSYNGAPANSVSASITDNDAAGVIVTESGGSTSATEGGATDTYTLVLTSQPTAAVTITVTGDADIGGSPASLTFTSANWNVAQTVTATAVNDALAEGAHSGTLTHAASSADAGYNAIGVASVTASITDNDTAGVVVTESGGSTTVTEGGATDTYTIVLTSQPTADVTITVAGDADIGGSPASLTFTSVNWNVAQTVTVTAVNDALVEGAHTGTLTHAASSGDLAYNAAPVAGVVAAITDNDAAGVIVTESGGSTSVTEGGATDTYTIVLTSQPTADVTIAVTGDADIGGSPASLTFTSANWNVAQTVTATAVNDALAEGTHGGTLTHSASSADAGYNAISVASVTASVADNDTAGVTVTQSGGSTFVTEGGASDTYTLVLNSQPTANVTITVTGDADIGGSPGSLTFTPANWNVAQTVTATAANDALAEGTHGGTLTHSASSADAGYNAIGVASVTASITDNDTAGVVVTESGGATSVTEGGATDTLTVRLTSQPTATVTITVAPDSQISATPATLTFTTANWNVAQTVTVRGVDDNQIEGAHTAVLGGNASSADAAYNGTLGTITVAVTDNDSATAGEEAPGVVVTPSGNTATSGGGGAFSWGAVLALFGLAGLRRRATRGLAAVLALLAGPALAQAPAVRSGLSYSSVELRYLTVAIDEPGVDASGFLLAGSWAVSRDFNLLAAYGAVETDDFSLFGVTGSSQTDTVAAGLGWHRPLNSRVDVTAALGVLSASAKGQGGFGGSSDDTGFSAEAGLRGIWTPRWQWGLGLSHVSIFSDDDTALSAQTVYGLGSGFALLAGAGVGGNSSQFSLGARYNF